MKRILLLFIVLILVGCGDQKEKKAITEIETLLKFREYSKAMSVLKEALKEKPESKNLLRCRIRLLLKAEQPDLAYAAYRQFTEKVSPKDEVLLEALEDGDATVRKNAAKVLSVAKEPESVKALIKRVKDPEEEVRRAVINALRELKDPRATAVLLEALKDDSWFVRAEAAQALGAIGAKEAVAALWETLKDADDYVKQAASAALLDFAKPENHEMFVKEFAKSDNTTRLTSALALAKLQDNRGKALLLETLKFSSDARVRRLCVEGLMDLKDKMDLALLQQIALGDKDSQVRLAAITALGLMPDEESLVILQQIVQDPHNSRVVQEQAREASLVIRETLSQTSSR